MLKHITEAIPAIRPFPLFEDVFGEPGALHRKHFLPLVSVDVSAAHADLTGWLHVVTPIEPLLEGNVGDWTAADHFDFYNRVGQIAFRVIDGRYTFAGDFQYFAYESGSIFRWFPRREEEIHSDYRLRVESFERNRESFRDCGRIPWSSSGSFDPSADVGCGPLVTQLGGEPQLGNWTGAGVPTNRSGKPFRFICEVQGFSYCEGGIQAIMLFYDPEEQIALFIFDWT